MRPTTGYEDHQEYSTRAEETAFLSEVAADTEATVEIAGYSTLGNPIWCVTLGNPEGPTFMLQGAVHGREPSGREAALAWIRDLAYDTSTATAEFLANHHIVVVPTINTDGIEPPRHRNNANDVNINRNWHQLTELEARVVRRVHQRYQPDLVLDLHEWDTKTVEANVAYNPSTRSFVTPRPGLAALGTALVEKLDDVAGDHGYEIYPYPQLATQGKYTDAAAVDHRLGLLLEMIQFQIAIPDRITFLQALFTELMAWHAANATEIAAARQQSLQDAIDGVTPLMRPCLGVPTWEVIPDPGSYTIPDGWEIPQELVDLHGIEIIGRTVSTRQAARQTIAALFDPESTQYIVGTEWLPTPPPPAPASQNLSMTVKRDGIRRRIIAAYTKRDGIRQRVTEAYVKRDGIRQRV